MKRLLIFILFLLSYFFSTVYALTINGGIAFTVESARIESFENVPKVINISDYQIFLKDENFLKNSELLRQNKEKYKNRYLMGFSNGSYSIRYKSDINVSYYYDNLGNLKSIEFDKGTRYPCKRIGYDKNGILDNVTLDVSNNEQFVFDANKKLIAHWIDNNCYNEQGELIMTRERQLKHPN